MQTNPVGVSSLISSRLAYGCWRLAGSWNPSEVTAASEAAGRRAVITAYEAGYTHFDNADIYCHGIAERLFGEAMKQIPGMREKVIVTTKCGIRFAGDPVPSAPARYDFSKEHIIRACEGSLKRMQIETIDLYLLHRPDYLCDPAEVAEAFSQLKAAGKVKYFGVSNFRPAMISALQAACPMPLVTHQVEISLARLGCLDDGTLDQCLTDKMTPMAWSPLAGGALAGGGDAKSVRIQGALDAVAKAHGTNRTVVALAWLLKHPSRILPVIGSVNPVRISEAVVADKLHLSREEWYQLLLAARGEPLP